MRPFIVALLLSLAACASGVDGVRQGIAATASTISAGYKAIAKYDAIKQESILQRAKAGHVPEAEAEFGLYKIKRGTLISVLDDASAVVEAANAAIPLLERGIAKDKSVSGWIADLVAVGLKVVQALNAAGIKNRRLTMFDLIVEAASELGQLVWQAIKASRQASAEQHAAILDGLKTSLVAMRAVAASVKQEIADRDAATQAELDKLKTP